MKDLGKVSYFLGLEINRTSAGFFVSQHKYTTDLLKDINMLNAFPLKIPMDAHLKLTLTKGDPLIYPIPYPRLVGKLIYLTLTCPDITLSF